MLREVVAFCAARETKEVEGGVVVVVGGGLGTKDEKSFGQPRRPHTSATHAEKKKGQSKK